MKTIFSMLILAVIWLLLESTKPQASRYICKGFSWLVIWLGLYRLLAAHPKGHKWSSNLLLCAYLTSILGQVHLFCCWSILSLVLKSTFEFLGRLKTSSFLKFLLDARNILGWLRCAVYYLIIGLVRLLGLHSVSLFICLSSFNQFYFLKEFWIITIWIYELQQRLAEHKKKEFLYFGLCTLHFYSS